jgi:hypothetical protein
MTQETFVPISLDASLDDIADLPTFKAFPSGAYIVTLEKGMESKKIGEHPAIDMPMTLKEVAEVTEKDVDESELPKPGDIANIAFMLDNNVGAGKLKEVLKPIGEHLAISGPISAIIAQTKGLELLVILKRTKDKDNAERKYNSIVKVSVI